ncbi:MAG: PGN_0703 family putative restriction endonuclease [Kiritimatiellia bacterium]
MGKFLESERDRQAQFKQESPDFSGAARQSGEYKDKPRLFCLPPSLAKENLFSGFRAEADEWFCKHKIKWHDGLNGRPSNHLCDSQVCCVNFLFAFADQPELLATLLKPIFPEIKQMIPVEDGKFVTFEWIGKKNYLGERVREEGSRTRGANCTSADAIVAFERTDGKRQIVLIEWKYTEAYHSIHLKTAPSGTDRTTIYRTLFDKVDCPLANGLIPSFESLFYEPFYQFMRQQLLAQAMETAKAPEADIVSLLHIAPAHNTDFRKVTSPELKNRSETLGDTATGVWAKLVKPATDGVDRFKSVSTERLFSPLLAEPPAELKDWAEYLTQRYPWVMKTVGV